MRTTGVSCERKLQHDNEEPLREYKEQWIRGVPYHNSLLLENWMVPLWKTEVKQHGDAAFRWFSRVSLMIDWFFLKIIIDFTNQATLKGASFMFPAASHMFLRVFWFLKKQTKKLLLRCVDRRKLTALSRWLIHYLLYLKPSRVYLKQPHEDEIIQRNSKVDKMRKDKEKCDKSLRIICSHEIKCLELK